MSSRRAPFPIKDSTKKRPYVKVTSKKYVVEALLNLFSRQYYCASSAPAPLIPPRLTETKAQHESSITEQALEAELLLAPSTSSTLCILCEIS